MTQTDMGFDAPRKPRMPVEPIVRTAQIEGRYRYSAERAWGAGPHIMWCLLNPSVADGKRDDPTMLRMMGFSYRWGFGSMTVVNIYPFISSDTTALWIWRKAWSLDATKNSEGGREALSAFIDNAERVRVRLKTVDKVVAAWGNGAEQEDLQHFETELGTDWESLSMMSRGVPPVRPIEWHCLGTTASGAPIHPLARGKHRVPDNATLQRWSRT